MLLSGQELWAVCFLRKSKGPSSEKGNRTTLFDVHPHNKIYNILYMVPIVIIIMYIVLNCSRPSAIIMFETNLNTILLCVYIFE